MNDIYAIRYNSILGSTAEACDLIRFFGSAEKVFAAEKAEIEETCLLSPAALKKLFSEDDGEAEKILSQLKENGWTAVSPGDDLYPDELMKIRDFPTVLYCCGNTELLKKKDCAAIVGTRSASARGCSAAFGLASFLSQNGITVVSGAAEGIDSAAHEGALTGRGSTTAVLGYGFGADYLPSKKPLRELIAAEGLLITELAPFTPPSRYTFPRRNRIIAGLSKVTAVAESGRSGGSLITADFAMRSHKPVYCFPPDIIRSPGSSLLFEKGAAAIRDFSDILAEFGMMPAAAEKTDIADSKIQEYFSSFSREEAAFRFCFSPVETDEIPGENESGKEAAPSPVPKQKAENGRQKQKTESDVFSVSPPEEQKKEIPAYLSENAKTVLSVLKTEPLFFDEINYLTKLEITDIMVAVT